LEAAGLLTSSDALSNTMLESTNGDMGAFETSIILLGSKSVVSLLGQHMMDRCRDGRVIFQEKPFYALFQDVAQYG